MERLADALEIVEITVGDWNWKIMQQNTERSKQKDENKNEQL